MSLVDNFFFFLKPQCLSFYGLDDLHGTELGADAAVLAFGIAAQLQITV